MASNKKQKLFVIAVVAAWCVVMIGIHHMYSLGQRLDTVGVRTDGSLDHEYTEYKSNRGGQWYITTYSFTVNGTNYSGQNRLSSEPTSGRATVIYDPADPSNNRLENGGRDSTTIRVLGAGGLLLTTLLLIFLSDKWSDWRSRRQQSLNRS